MTKIDDQYIKDLMINACLPMKSHLHGKGCERMMCMFQHENSDGKGDNGGDNSVDDESEDDDDDEQSD
jgi:hypothetical protein